MSACIYLKQNTGRFSKTMSVSFFASLSEHPGFNWSWTIPLFWRFLWPPILSDSFLPDWNTASLRSRLLFTHHKQSQKMWHLIPNSLKIIFSMLGVLSPSASKTAFNPWNSLLLLQNWGESGGEINALQLQV